MERSEREKGRDRAYERDIEDGAALPQDIKHEERQGPYNSPEGNRTVREVGQHPRQIDASTVGDMHAEELSGDAETGAGVRSRDTDDDAETRRLDNEARLRAGSADKRHRRRREGMGTVARDERERTRADEEIIESGAAVPPEILEPSAAAIAESRRKAREDDPAEAAAQDAPRDMDKPARQ